MTTDIRGVITPILTPFEDDFSIADPLFFAHARRCLEAGSHYLAPFGTTGEATSLGLTERMHALERLADAVGAERLIPGTGLPSLPDTVELTRHARRIGCAAALVLPPWFVPEPGDDGLFRHFAALVEALGPAALPLLLYNIPQNTRVPLSPALAARLAQAFPGVIAGYKDSSGKWETTRGVLEAAPELAVFAASEVLMARAMPLGAAGCISATCNSNPAAIRRLFDRLDEGDAEAVESLLPEVEAHRRAAERAGFVPGLKSLMALQTGESRWLNTRPPLVHAPRTLGEELALTLDPGDA